MYEMEQEEWGKTIETVGTAFVVSDSESRKFAATRSKQNGH